MAYDKIIVIHSRLDRCLDYVQNDGKTDLGNAVDYICNPVKAGFQTAINCTLDKSFLQMQETNGYGSRCFEEKNLADLYLGRALNEDVGLLSGATLTSQAMKTAIQAAQAAIKEVS